LCTTFAVESAMSSSMTPPVSAGGRSTRSHVSRTLGQRERVAGQVTPVHDVVLPSRLAGDHADDVPDGAELGEPVHGLDRELVRIGRAADGAVHVDRVLDLTGWEPLHTHQSPPYRNATMVWSSSRVRESVNA
jgi:hypothetical protein